MSAQLRSGSLGPPTLFFILHSKYNSHEGTEPVEDLFKYDDLNRLEPGCNPNTFGPETL